MKAWIQRHLPDRIGERQRGKIGYALAWLLGIPLPILFVVYLLRGCT
jgi:hypothetical protein